MRSSKAMTLQLTDHKAADGSHQSIGCVLPGCNRSKQTSLFRSSLGHRPDAGDGRRAGQVQWVKPMLLSNLDEIMDGGWAGKGDHIHASAQLFDLCRVRLSCDCAISDHFVHQRARRAQLTGEL